jgi:hypothetical protein
MPDKIRGSAIQSGTISSAQFSTALNNNISGGGPRITALAYPNSNTSTPTTGGDTITLTGSNFDANVAVYVNSNAAASVTRSNANSLTFTLGNTAVGIYPVYAINSDDGFAIYLPGIQVE